MLKKALGLVITAIMLLGVFGLAACNNVNLEEYKATKNQALQAYADAKYEANSYCTEGLAAISTAVTDGKAEIDKATSSHGVDTAYKAATDAIDKVATVGAFYRLQKAFDNGWLTKENLQSIAYYHNDDTMPVYPEALSTDLAEKIKYDFVNYANCQDAEHDIQIKYYGTYNGCVSAMIDGCQHYLDVEGLESVDGVIFYYGSSQRILIWRETDTAEGDKMVKQVKQTYVDEFLKAEHSVATIDDVIITEYLGTYGGSFVAVLNDSYNRFFTEVEIPLAIDGLDFSYSNGYPIRVWNSGKIYNLADAYEQELLTKEDLQAIYNLYNNKTEQQKI